MLLKAMVYKSATQRRCYKNYSWYQKKWQYSAFSKP